MIPMCLRLCGPASSEHEDDFDGRPYSDPDALIASTRS
jgi:hypothetical protein